MKTRIVTLLITLFAFAWSAKADEITSLRLTISHNGEPAFTQEFPPSGWEEFVLDEQTTSIIISKVEVETSGNVTDIAFAGTMYSTSEGGQSNDDEWRSMPLENIGNGKWELDMGEGVDLVEKKWLGQNKTKTFEFYVHGTGGSGNQLLYNNGGANYKVTFSTGESADWKIKFLEENTARLDLRVNDEVREYSFDGKGNRNPSDQLGQLSSLVIDRLDLWFHLADGMTWPDVSCQYRVYEEGQEIEGGWNRLDLPNAYVYASEPLHFFAQNAEFNVTDGLKPGKNYVLEVNYQVVVDGEYIFLGKNKEGSKFRFYYEDGVVPGDSIRSFKLTVVCDGEGFTESFPSEGWPQKVIKGQVASIKIVRAEVETDASLTYLGFCSTIYDTADGWQHDDSAWDWIPFENQGGGHWVLDWSEGKQVIKSEWLDQNVTKTLEFFVSGGDAEGITYKYSNGLTEQGYDNNYKVTFTTGIDPDGVQLIPASEANGATYNLAGQRVGKDYKGIVVVGGSKALIK